VNRKHADLVNATTGTASNDDTLFRIPKAAAANMLAAMPSLDTPALLVALAHFIKRFAHTPISHFNVGAAGR
jgi:hypothetical protein